MDGQTAGLTDQKVAYTVACPRLKIETGLNKAGYTATEVACGWAGAIFEVTRPFGQLQ